MRPIDLARAAGLSTQQIRNYADDGVLPPTPRTPAGYRRFDARHRQALLTYRALAARPRLGRRPPDHAGRARRRRAARPRTRRRRATPSCTAGARPWSRQGGRWRRRATRKAPSGAACASARSPPGWGCGPRPCACGSRRGCWRLAATRPPATASTGLPTSATRG
ncbi:MerR family DNA-binding transcriptional regulator [Nonomuraea ferruginea]